ncbi:MAG: CPBP family intramembrane metalloprotease [Oscillospiraceae bacterium]|nr:CPBP family intramembrane metalloprotease [Oscillospiraceae bacterium]
MKLSISMTRREFLLGWAYLLIDLFALPLLLNAGNQQLLRPLSETELNLVYFFVNFLMILIIFRKFLSNSLRQAIRAPWQCLRFAVLGFILYYLAMIAVSHGITYLKPDFVNVNDAAVMDMTQEQFTLMSIATVFLVPITEEVLFRGLLFQGLHKRSRFLAYAASTLVFSLIHVTGYVGRQDGFTLLLCFVQYVPASVALAWAYEKSDTILSPMLIHMTVNQISISAMR